MKVLVGLVLIPVAVLIVWIAMPPLRTLMADVTANWGASVGLEGLALVIAQALPIIVPVVCILGLVLGLVFTVRGLRGV